MRSCKFFPGDFGRIQAKNSGLLCIYASDAGPCLGHGADARGCDGDVPAHRARLSDRSGGRAGDGGGGGGGNGELETQGGVMSHGLPAGVGKFEGGVVPVGAAQWGPAGAGEGDRPSWMGRCSDRIGRLFM